MSSLSQVARTDLGAVCSARAAESRFAGTAPATYSADFLAVQRLARVALLSAIALILSYVETMIPLPTALPGVKLGLANVAVVVALFGFDVRTAFFVALVKVLAAGFLFGSPVMLVYSLGGTVLAFACMALMKQIRGISVVVVSMASAIFHNAGQIAVACVLLGSPAVLISLPPLAVAACITGALTGCVAAGVLGKGGSDALRCLQKLGAQRNTARRVRFLRKRSSSPGAGSAHTGSSFGKYCASETLANRLDARTKLLFTAMFFIVAFAEQGGAGIVVMVVAALLSLASARVGFRMALSYLRPFSGLLVFVAVMDVLFTSTGAVLLSAGPLAITNEGVALAVTSTVRFCALMLGTATLMRTTSPSDLTEGMRSLLSPLQHVGVRVDNAALALGMTFRFIPVFSDEFARVKRAQESRLANFSGGLASCLCAYVSVFIPLFANAFRRADSVAFALQGRGFGSSVRSSLQEGHMRFADGMVLAFSGVLLMLAVCL